MAKQKLILGRKDKVDFPLLNLFNIDAKIDSGADTSALHCDKIQLINKHGIYWVKFRFNHKKEFSLPIFAIRKIKNSSGKSEKRFIIKTKIRLFNKRYPVELSLSDRSRMEYPVLLGRKLLLGRFLVDVSQKDLSYKQKKKK